MWYSLYFLVIIVISCCWQMRWYIALQTWMRCILLSEKSSQNRIRCLKTPDRKRQKKIRNLARSSKNRLWILKAGPWMNILNTSSIFVFGFNLCMWAHLPDDPTHWCYLPSYVDLPGWRVRRSTANLDRVSHLEAGDRKSTFKLWNTASGRRAVLGQKPCFAPPLSIGLQQGEGSSPSGTPYSPCKEQQTAVIRSSLADLAPTWIWSSHMVRALEKKLKICSNCFPAGVYFLPADKRDLLYKHTHPFADKVK